MKINLFKFLFVLWLAFCSGIINAQNVAQQNLAWTSTTVVDIKNNAPSMPFQCSFKTFSNQSIDWIQKSGAEVYQYTVVSIEGSWTNVMTDGTIQYNVFLGTSTGSFVFTRSNGQLSVRLRTYVDNELDLDLIFNLSTVEPLN